MVEPSSSPWASPIVLVQKFCVDYRRLNSLTKLDVFPLPRIDDTLDLLAGKQYFTTLDLAAGYWQDPSWKGKTAFVTSSGLYQFLKMPFGLVNAPSDFPAVNGGGTDVFGLKELYGLPRRHPRLRGEYHRTQ